jgi:hypothetical protein
LIDTTGEPDMENQFTTKDRRFLVEMSAEMAAKVDTSIPEGAAFKAAFDKLIEAVDPYFASIRRA